MSFKKGYEIIKTSKKHGFNGIEAGGQKMDFRKKKLFRTDDPALAKDIQQTAGQDGAGDVMVIPVDNLQEDRSRTHNYKFTLRDLGDWKARIDWS